MAMDNIWILCQVIVVFNNSISFVSAIIIYQLGNLPDG